MYKVIYTFLYSMLHYKAQVLSIQHCTGKKKILQGINCNIYNLI